MFISSTLVNLKPYNDKTFYTMRCMAILGMPFKWHVKVLRLHDGYDILCKHSKCKKKHYSLAYNNAKEMGCNESLKYWMFVVQFLISTCKPKLLCEIFSIVETYFQMI